ncbi:hypothetical protein [Fibrobacter sp.]|uniref:hypothetical protein n=1 Tax=Fibrobacter sp. TaxID=35828 RepID=UPI0025C18245|nr:hypothetical protein [Fibrobacter sp.]MBR4007302.1 hypothetical protein [Fibrobacter sp.]
MNPTHNLDEHENTPGEGFQRNEKLNLKKKIFSESPDDSQKYIANSYKNVSTDEIIITRDKLENILLKHLKRVDKAKSWIAPLTLLITLLATLLTTSFNSYEHLPAATLQALFIFFFIASIIWLIKDIVDYNSIRKKISIDELIGMITNHQEEIKK